MPLPSEVSREIGQIAHRGKAGRVRELVQEAVDALEAEGYADAIEPLAAAKRDAPRSPSIRELLGLAYYHLERWRESAAELAAYRRLSGRADQDHVYADCERALGRPDRALEILAEPAPDDADDELLVERLLVTAGAHSDLGRYAEAVDTLLRGPVEPRSVEPHHLRLWYALADALEAAGRRRDARSWWDAVYAEDPEFFDVADRRLGLRSSG